MFHLEVASLVIPVSPRGQEMCPRSLPPGGLLTWVPASGKGQVTGLLIYLGGFAMCALASVLGITNA